MRTGLLFSGVGLLIAAAWSNSTAAGENDTTARQARAFGLDVYRELIEINTTQSTGDTHRAAQAMAARLLAEGFPPEDVRVFETAPKRGNLVARLRGSGKKRPILLLAHTDVVE